MLWVLSEFDKYCRFKKKLIYPNMYIGREHKTCTIWTENKKLKSLSATYIFNSITEQMLQNLVESVERRILTLLSQVPFAYPDMCGIQREA